MSIARGRVLGLCRRSIRIPLSAAPSRLASSDSHSSHEDTNVYPPETFNTPFWRRIALISFLGVGLYKIMPLIDPDGDYITRYIELYVTPADVWKRINDKHLELAMKAAQGQMLISAAQRPIMHRLRNPASLDVGSPHRIAVGNQVEVSDVVVKKDKPWAE